MHIDLSVVWFVIIVFGTLMYIVMDGFDLGIGILMPVTRDIRERDTMVNTVAPVWDGNETWLVLGGAALYGAFPLAYSIIVDALSVPLTLMLVGLIFRGVAFEFRFKAFTQHRQFWDRAFIVGSMGATFCQGVVVGSVVQGFDVQNQTFVGHALDWLAPFPLFCGLGLMATYALLGATWLIMKTDGQTQQHGFALAPKLLVLLLVFVVVVSLWTLQSHPRIEARWFNAENAYALLLVPLCTLIAAYFALRGLKRQQEKMPFIASLVIVLLGFVGLGISLWPNIIPPSVSIWDAASPEISQGFMLVGALFILPVILIYTFWSYYVFRGKVKEGEAYH